MYPETAGSLQENTNIVADDAAVVVASSPAVVGVVVQ